MPLRLKRQNVTETMIEIQRLDSELAKAKKEMDAKNAGGLSPEFWRVELKKPT